MEASCATAAEQEQLLGPTHVALALERTLGRCPPLFELNADDMGPSRTLSAGTHVKTLVVHASGSSSSMTSKLVACVLALHQRLSLGRCATALSLRRADLRLVSPDELIPLCGYPRGGIGPVGWSAADYTILVDEALHSQAATSQLSSGNVQHEGNQGMGLILCGAGLPNLVFPIGVHTLVDSFAAMVAPISMLTNSSAQGGCDVERVDE